MQISQKCEMMVRWRNMNPLTWKHVLLAACIADLSACSSTKPIEEYAIEHNLLGDRVCNAALKRSSAADAEFTSCPAGAVSTSNVGEPQDEDKETTKEESAL